MTTRWRILVWGVGLLVTGTCQTPVYAQKHTLVYARDGAGTFGYKHTPIQPWSGFHVHDPDRPAPPKVDPGKAPDDDQVGTAPSDATVLFDGTDISKWLPSKWKVEDGCLVATNGPLTTQQEFGSCQLHLEWQVPVERTESIMNLGNNGVMLLGKIEVQIYDSYRAKIYPDGQAAAVYAQTPPSVNACRKPGAWQSYDIVFLAPRFDDSHKLLEAARITMLHNGVLVHHNQEIYGSTRHLMLANYDSVPSRGPLVLSAHHCPVRFRNIWIRSLENE